MKQIFLAAFLLVATYSVSFGQTASIVGKWKISKIVTPDITIDIEHPEVTRQALAKQIEAESGQKPDSAMMNMVMVGLLSSLDNAFFDFGSDGILKMNGGQGGNEKTESASYEVSYKDGIITSQSKQKGKQEMKFRFVNDLLVLETNDQGKKAEITLKKA